MKVFILTEGSKEVGFGHITRCTSLYEAFEERGITPEFIINGDDTIEELLGNKNHRIFNWFERENEVLDLINGANIAIIDSYLASYEFYKKVSELIKLPVYIDDIKRLEYPRGIVINGAIYAEGLNYPEGEGVDYLLGNNYIFLRKEFWEFSKKTIKKNIESTMITFGGNDMRNMIPKVLKRLCERYPDMAKYVIIGKAFMNIDEVEKASDKKTTFIYHPNTETMIKTMIKSDIAITAGGQTLLELIRVGVPSVVISIADNQSNIIQGLYTGGVIEYSGWWEDRDLLEKTLTCIKNFENKNIRTERSKLGTRLIDGMGSLRTVDYLIKKAREWIEKN